MGSLWWNRGRNEIFLVPDLHPNQRPILPSDSEGQSFSRKIKQFFFFFFSSLRVINHWSIWEWTTNPNKIQHCIFDNFMAKEAELQLRYSTNSPWLTPFSSRLSSTCLQSPQGKDFFPFPLIISDVKSAKWSARPCQGYSELASSHTEKNRWRREYLAAPSGGLSFVPVLSPYKMLPFRGRCIIKHSFHRCKWLHEVQSRGCTSSWVCSCLLQHREGGGNTCFLLDFIT